MSRPGAGNVGFLTPLRSLPYLGQVAGGLFGSWHPRCKRHGRFEESGEARRPYRTREAASMIPIEWLNELIQERDGYRRLLCESGSLPAAAYRLAHAKCLARERSTHVP